jgi:hypothetical protein
MGSLTSYLMSLITAADAVAALNAAGHSARKSPARSRGGCRTLCYLVDGQYVNLGRLRQLAREVLSPKALAAEPPAAEPAAAEPPAIAQVEVDPYKRGQWQRVGIGPDPVDVAERRAARWAERNPEHSYRVVLVAPTAERLARAKAEAAPIVAAIAAAPKPVRLNATAEPLAAKPVMPVSIVIQHQEANPHQPDWWRYSRPRHQVLAQPPEICESRRWYYGTAADAASDAAAWDRANPRG